MRLNNFLVLLCVVLIAVVSTAAIAQPGKRVAPAVARVLDQNISRFQIDLDEHDRQEAERQYKGAAYDKYVNDYRAEQLATMILGPLLREYAKTHGITASTQEINSMSRVVFHQRVARGANRTLAEAAVIQWKISRALYRQYGGTVIFQQSNPYEPVGAYAKFLEEREVRTASGPGSPRGQPAWGGSDRVKQPIPSTSGPSSMLSQAQRNTFEILDPKLRELFWCYFKCEQSMIVPPEKVNYDTPWWLQKKQ